MADGKIGKYKFDLGDCRMQKLYLDLSMRIIRGLGCVFLEDLLQLVIFPTQMSQYGTI